MSHYSGVGVVMIFIHATFKKIKKYKVIGIKTLFKNAKKTIKPSPFVPLSHDS